MNKIKIFACNNSLLFAAGETRLKYKQGFYS